MNFLSGKVVMHHLDKFIVIGRFGRINNHITVATFFGSILDQFHNSCHGFFDATDFFCRCYQTIFYGKDGFNIQNGTQESTGTGDSAATFQIFQRTVYHKNIVGFATIINNFYDFIGGGTSFVGFNPLFYRIIIADGIKFRVHQTHIQVNPLILQIFEGNFCVGISGASGRGNAGKNISVIFIFCRLVAEIFLDSKGSNLRSGNIALVLFHKREHFISSNIYSVIVFLYFSIGRF